MGRPLAPHFLPGPQTAQMNQSLERAPTVDSH